MSNNWNPVILQASTLDNKKAFLVLRRVLQSDKNERLIWTLSGKSAVWDSEESALRYLRDDFGKYLLYFAYQGDTVRGVFGALNLEVSPPDGNLLVWLEESFRSSPLTLGLWVRFMQNLRGLGVQNVVARIKTRNQFSLRAALRFGFQQGEVIKSQVTGQEERVFMMRPTILNFLEIKYQQRMHRLGALF